jgi:nicotinamide mononucleotide adenylyltransferase
VIRAPFAVVHGRFQPFHREHLAYCRLGLERGQILVVGITNFDPDLARPEPTNPHRHQPVANPFTYWERALMIRDALLEDGVPPERLLLVAFPIHHPERWVHYLPCDPADAVHVIRVFSPWETEKARRLEAAGLRVDVIESGAKRLSASEVRARIAAGDGWEGLVPKAVREWIVRLDGVRRLRQAGYSPSPLLDEP